MSETPRTAKSISSVLFGKTRLAILSLLYSRTPEAFFLRQIVRLSGAGLGPVQRELKRLVEAGIVRREVQGRKTYYRANPDSPVFSELQNLLTRPTAGTGTLIAAPPVDVPVKVALDRLAAFCAKHHITKLSFFGSVLRSDFGPTSDVDVLVEFEPGRKPGYFGLYDMEEELTGLFGGRKADIRTAEDISRCFRQRVVNEARVQYATTR